MATACALLLFSAPAFALSLQEARERGLVGETAAGYVEALSQDPEVQGLVNEVNDGRRQAYQRISQQNGQPVDVVAKLAVPQIVANLPSGAKYKGADGTWKTK